MSESDYEEVCTVLRGQHADANFGLCEPATEAPCDVAAAAGPHPAVSCPLLPFTIDLGAGATLHIVMASGHVSAGGEVFPATPFGHNDSGFENARSLAGVISWGALRYHFGGDLTGSGEFGEPDLESHLIEHAGDALYGTLGVDVTHVHHHARRTSSNSAFVNALAPLDGRSRNVVAGISPAHVGSPHAEVLAAWGDEGRLGAGRFWVTDATVTSGVHEVLEVADGDVRVQTVMGGAGYWVQAVPRDGSAPWALAFEALRH